MKHYCIIFALFLISYSINAQALCGKDSLLTSETFLFRVENGLTLKGLISLPIDLTKQTKIVVLVSPPLSIDKNYGGMFLSLAKSLAQQGIATIRFDNCYFADSTLMPKNEVVTMDDLANDVHYLMEALRKDKRFLHNPIGLLGHSEGGSAAIIEAARNEDVSFLVTLSTCGISGVDFAYWQSTLPFSYSNFIPEKLRNATVRDIYEKLQIVKNSDSEFELKTAMTEQVRQKAVVENLTLSEQEVQNIVSQWTKPRFSTFVKYIPEIFLSKVMCPVLAVHGMMDGTLDWKANLDGIEKAFIKSGKTNYKIIALENVNHSYEQATKIIPFFISISYRPGRQPLYLEKEWLKIALWINKYDKW